MTRHRFSFNDPERARWQNPESILSELGLHSGCTFIDVGCGEGFFALPACELVGPKGKVYAVDIDGESIAALSKEAERRKLTHLTARIATAERTVFCDSCADMVFYGIVLHDFSNPLLVLENARRMIKPDGCVVDLDWKKEPMEFGPPVPKRFSENQASELLESTGFRVTTVEESDPYHYMLIAKLAAHRKT